jgi:hypothetical protein
MSAAPFAYRPTSCVIVDAAGVVVAFVSVRHAENEAVGHTLAAAPRLLAALKGVIRVADRATDEFDEARAAIAACEGGS